MSTPPPQKDAQRLEDADTREQARPVPCPRIIDLADLESGAISRSFVGAVDGGGIPMSFFLVDAAPGEGAALHRHDYVEVFIVQEGEAIYTIGEDQRSVSAGQIIVVPAGTSHAFTSLGPGRLRQIDIHLSPRFVTEWLTEHDCEGR